MKLKRIKEILGDRQMTIDQLLKMPVGEKTGGFVLTIKKTKKAVQLPNKQYIHTVVLFDETGEMLADFKDQGGKGAYNPMIKGQEVKIIVSEIQQAETGIKLYIDQFALATGNSEPDLGYAPGEDYPDWRTTVRGKIRHGLTCSYIKSGKEPDKDTVKKWTEFIMTGE